MKICAYIAGDKNIINPSIVCLSSVKKHNKDIDVFIFSELQAATNEQLRLCKKYDITFIDTSNIENKNIINEFCEFQRWPVHVFYNYIAPHVLYTKGYDFAIKLDYDMLCINSFSMNEILPENEEGISVYLQAKLTACVDKENLKKLKDKFTINDYRAANVGFIVFNLEYYTQNKILDTFKDIFTYCNNNIIRIAETTEQFCFGLLQGVLRTTFKHIPYTYNFRPYSGRCDLDEKVKILHYNCKDKPWHPIPALDYDRIKKDYFIRFIMSFIYWIEYANSLDFTETWYENRDISLKTLYRIQNESMFKLDMQDKKRLLENYVLFLQKDGVVNDSNIFYDNLYRYVQIRLFSEKSIHYELLFKGNKIAICIHFEQAWNRFIDYLQNTVCKQISLNMIRTPQTAEIYYIIEDINDINKVCATTATIIKQTYDSIFSFITMHDIFNTIININNREKDKTITLLKRQLKAIDERTKFIYEATVGDKKDNSNFVFDTIYKQKIWGNGSGQGSTPKVLQEYIAFLEKFIRDHRITSIADIGCGDWQYMRHVDLSGIDYTGYDVASTVIEANRQNFAASNIKFIHYDGDFSTIKAADLAICKDVLQHIPNKNIFEFLKHIKKFKYVLVANSVTDNMTCNADIEMGQMRLLDLRLPPFNVTAEAVFTIDRKQWKRPDIVVLLIKN